MQEVSALCDSIVVIAAGRVVAQGTPDELRRQTGHEESEDAFVALSGLERGNASERRRPVRQAFIVCREKELRDSLRDPPRALVDSVQRRHRSGADRIHDEPARRPAA